MLPAKRLSTIKVPTEKLVTFQKKNTYGEGFQFSPANATPSYDYQ